VGEDARADGDLARSDVEGSAAACPTVMVKRVGNSIAPRSQVAASGHICNASITYVPTNFQALRLVELEDETAPLWRALADPTRRRILDLLRARPRITGEIASEFAVSRIAVMRHLEVLAEAGLVTSRKRGRERWHYLNAVPLERLHERWHDPLAAGWASSLLRLQRNVERDEGRRVKPTDLAIDLALDVAIEGTPAEVFSALTRDPGGWWGHPFLRAGATDVTLEPRLGGLLLEHWEEGGAVLAAVTGWQDDRHLTLSGPFHHVTVGVATFDLTPTVSGTLVKFSFRAVGVVDPEIAEAMPYGWNELLSTRLKALVESGKRLGVAADRRPTPIRRST
jgi:DNA-binding transcriptional ArsR family regulator